MGLTALLPFAGLPLVGSTYPLLAKRELPGSPKFKFTSLQTCDRYELRQKWLNLAFYGCSTVGFRHVQTLTFCSYSYYGANCAFGDCEPPAACLLPCVRFVKTVSPSFHPTFRPLSGFDLYGRSTLLQ